MSEQFPIPAKALAKGAGQLNLDGEEEKPLEGEAAILAECEELVRAGQAKWV